MVVAPHKKKLAQRIRLLIDEISQAGGQKAAAKKLGISEAILSNYLRLKATPKYDFFHAVGRHTGYNLNWLILGEGPMRRRGYNPEADAIMLFSRFLDVWAEARRGGKPAEGMLREVIEQMQEARQRIEKLGGKDRS
jgi:hypothetical protein